MTSTVSLLRDIEIIKRALLPSEKDYTMVCAFGPEDEPHGKYKHRIVHVLSGEIEPVAEEDEVAALREFYETRVPLHAKIQHDGYSWATFEDFLEAHKCKCGKQHPYFNPEYSFRNVIRSHVKEF